MSTPPSHRTRVRRVAENAAYDNAVVHAIVDDAYVCHIAFTDDHGTHCIPTACWREGNHLYIHGSNGSRMLKRLMEQDVCVTITLVDGLVLARSAFNHSMNYRSAMIYGRFEKVPDDDKPATLATFMESLVPGRQADIRPGSDKEHAATTVLRITLDEAACKVRAGGPVEEAGDEDYPAWSGVLPLTRVRGAPETAEGNAAPVPAYVLDWQRRA
ncbi:pyridoxamine 5'-phosphate oxidase family protein [Pseudoduganella ginsengisoli]|uniref:Pyridoxamine 5'-phosphate oxidase family protein n=1 Tax=Pseudoduganella ginsengisoli TaxID=1462440 RepID=A0A6L6Q2J1_9BURK|nr:pyridoxamine 5'-phosphate oxidase family protein [Pseudoduganella ginsengisoli]MTW03634.1 pyridoxamine 5'-phosphate oxidase family protein [Pseudoduganella ginsengisoli]